MGHPQTNGEAPRLAYSLPQQNSLLGSDWLGGKFLTGLQKERWSNKERYLVLSCEMEVQRDTWKWGSLVQAQLCLHLLCDLQQLLTFSEAVSSSF